MNKTQTSSFGTTKRESHDSSKFYNIHTEIGFLPMGEIIWQKARGASGSCAWGSWKGNNFANFEN